MTFAVLANMKPLFSVECSHSFKYSRNSASKSAFLKQARKAAAGNLDVMISIRSFISLTKASVTLMEPCLHSICSWYMKRPRQISPEKVRNAQLIRIFSKLYNRSVNFRHRFQQDTFFLVAFPCNLNAFHSCGSLGRCEWMVQEAVPYMLYQIRSATGVWSQQDVMSYRQCILVFM